jgi:hypothetical protein
MNYKPEPLRGKGQVPLCFGNACGQQNAIKGYFVAYIGSLFYHSFRKEILSRYGDYDNVTNKAWC